MDVILIPPVAFLLYLGLVGLLSLAGRQLSAGSTLASPEKSSTYASGEAPPEYVAAPGYRPFFVIALFFAILHLGILVLGSGELSPEAGAYLIGLIVALLALILG
ncbi:MAG: hypothetical protein GYB66_01130 [Chloroflexi bacterium]|nr:hypothetical protein [Chloroflexota bacterium]